MKNKLTIHDVAAHAGVSISTVSRVLNTPGLVAEDKRLAVQEAIAALEYVPDPVARTMGGKKTGTIAVIVPNISNGTISEIVDGIATEAEANKYNILLFSSNENPAKEFAYINNDLKAQMINGAIFICGSGMEMDFEPLLRIMPVVTIDRVERAAQLSTVCIDEEGGFSAIIKHLKKQGHQKIGYLSGDTETMSGRQRLHTFRSVMAQEGLAVSKESIVSSPWTLQGAYDACELLLAQYPESTAIVTASDIVALGALSALRNNGRTVPKDISICGFDNFPLGKYSSPPLTTLRYPSYHMGCIAMRQMINQITNSKYPVQNHTLPLNLLERNSTCKVKI